jgi:hypothetical protein
LARQTVEDVESGKVSAEDAAKDLEAKSEALKKKAKDTTSSAIDAAKYNGNLTDDQKKQLEDAQKQLEATP